MIGIFDSGEGGLSVFREIFKLLPGEEYVYYSDNAYCPYGNKPQDYVIDRARKITQFLIDEGSEVIVVACNTATAVAIETLRKEFPVRFIGMEPAVKPAALETGSGVIGVLATAATLKAFKYLSTKGKYSDDVKIAEQVGEGFVELVENGVLDGPKAEKVVEASLRPLLDAGADIIVLGCTHYPFLMKPISRIAGAGVRIIDPAPAVARQVVNVLKGEKLISAEEAEKALSRESMPAVFTPDDIYDRVRLLSSGDMEPLIRIFDLLIYEPEEKV